MYCSTWLFSLLFLLPSTKANTKHHSSWFLNSYNETSWDWSALLHCQDRICLFVFYPEEQRESVHNGHNTIIGFGIFNLIVMVKNCCITLLSSFHSFNETTAAVLLLKARSAIQAWQSYCAICSFCFCCCRFRKCCNNYVRYACFLGYLCKQIWHLFFFSATLVCTCLFELNINSSHRCETRTWAVIILLILAFIPYFCYSTCHWGSVVITSLVMKNGLIS